MFWCFRCSRVNISSEQFHCENCGKDTTDATGMENPEMPDFKYTHFGCNEPDEITVTANEVPQDLNFQILKSAFASLEYFSENNSIVSSDAYAHMIATTTPSISHGCDQLCDTVRPMDLNFSSALSVLKDFDMSRGSRSQQFLKDTSHILDEEIINRPLPKRAKSEMCAATFQGISNDGKQGVVHQDKAVKIDATSPITIDNSHLPSAIRGLSRTISDMGSPSGQAARSLDNILAVPGPSGIQRNVNTRNMCVENSKSTYSKKFCNICEKEYIERYLHRGEHICIVCNERFQCRTLYNEHLLDHSGNFTERCWVCTEYIRDHLKYSANKKLYKCCACYKWESDRLSSLISHNNVHKPEMYCKKCRKEYLVTDKEFHNGQFSCSICPSEFECKIQLEEHYDGHEDDLREICILCNEEKSTHDFEHNNFKFYKCCDCDFTFAKLPSLQSHLQGHTKLRLYKCDKCERRYMSKST